MKSTLAQADTPTHVLDYVHYFMGKEVAETHHNEAVDMVGEHFWQNDVTRKHVSKEMVHNALFLVNPSFYLLNDELNFEDQIQWSKVIAFVHRALRKTKAYQQEHENWLAGITAIDACSKLATA